MNKEIYETIFNMPNLMEKALMELNLNGDIKYNINKVAFFGMGGSGIAGRIISEWVIEDGKLQISAYNDMKIPRKIDKETLIVSISYSGNTEETIMVAENALRENYPSAIISSNGKLIEIAEKNNIPYVKIPQIFNQPREALPYLFIAAIKVLMEINFINSKHIKQIHETIKTLYNLREELSLDNVPRKIAEKIHNKFISIYTYDPLTVSAIRFKQSLNENSKAIAKVEVIPEAGHNAIMELEEDTKILGKMIMILIREEDIANRLIEKSIETFKELAVKREMELEEIVVKGGSTLSKIFSAIYLGDLTSVELANIKMIDARKIDSIKYLKSRIRELYLHT
ncbi:MAG: bifunctional phosphoglucose/phosphomannose isomerase [Candidatus Methanomethylicia archaeon]